MKLNSIITLCRPQQWVKNLFVFLPLFFSGNILYITPLIYCIIAFASFCLASSAIYCLNDMIDAEYDRTHPVKYLRPMASGEVDKVTCVFLALFLSVSSMFLLLLLPEKETLGTLVIIILYLILNLIYCVGLKKYALIDVTIISLGFVLRIIAGGVSSGISLSPWIIIMTFLLTLFLALSKRRDDILIFQTTGNQMRQNIDKYNLVFINQAITMVGTVMLVSYIIYTVSPDVRSRFNSDFVYTTSLFVLLGLLRYMQLAIVFSKTGSPTSVLLRDRFIQIIVAGWFILFTIIIYL